jgi:hypothetical protein
MLTVTGASTVGHCVHSLVTVMTQLWLARVPFDQWQYYYYSSLKPEEADRPHSTKCATQTLTFARNK